MKSFENFYAKFIENKNDELENDRIKYLNKYKKNFLIFKYSVIPVFIISIILIIIFNNGLFFFLSLVPFGFLGKALNIMSIANKTIQKKYKRNIVIPLLKYLYEENLEYKARQRMAINLLRKSLLFTKRVDYNSGDDYIKCKIGNTIIQFSEIKAYTTFMHNEKKIFSGVFISVDFNKYFKSKTIIYDKYDYVNFRKSTLNFLGKTENAGFIELEDKNFNNNFIVIGEDQVESRYILSPDFMQRLLNYKKAIGKNVSFSFIDNHLYIIIPNKINILELKLHISVYNKDYLLYNYTYLNSITNLVEFLNLNTKIWTKR